MSEVANPTVAAQVATPNPETNVAEVAETKTPLEKLEGIWEKKKRVVVRADGKIPQTVFGDFITARFNGAGETDPNKEDAYKDWLTKAVPNIGDNPTVAVVQVESTGENRLIGIPSKDVAFKDANIMETMYNILVNKYLLFAEKDDAGEDQFEFIGGIFKPRFNIEAFRDHAKEVIKILHGRGLKNISVSSLRLSMASDAYAKASFPQMQDKHWDIVFAVFRAKAEEAKQDTSIFDHWMNTRKATKFTAGTLEDFTLDSMLADMKEEDASGDEADHSAA